VRRTRLGGSGRVHCVVVEVELLKLKKNVQFPDAPVRIKGTEIHYVTFQTY
jgi:hypothetical protein